MGCVSNKDSPAEKPEAPSVQVASETKNEDENTNAEEKQTKKRTMSAESPRGKNVKGLSGMVASRSQDYICHYIHSFKTLKSSTSKEKINNWTLFDDGRVKMENSSKTGEIIETQIELTNEEIDELIELIKKLPEQENDEVYERNGKWFQRKERLLLDNEKNIMLTRSVKNGNEKKFKLWCKDHNLFVYTPKSMNKDKNE